MQENDRQLPERSQAKPRPAGLGRRHLLALGLALPFAARSIVARAQDTRVIRIGAGPTGGTDFLFGGLVANAVSNPPGTRECDKGGNCGVPGLIAVAQFTSDAVANLEAIDRGDLEMGLATADVASWAYAGTGAFSGHEPLSHLRLIARLYPASVHLVTRSTSNIHGIADLKGKRVGIGEQGYGTAATAKFLLSVYRIKASAVRLRYQDFSAVADALSNNTIDAMFIVGGAPVLALEDLARRTPIRVVPITGPVVTKLTQTLPLFGQGSIPAGTYGMTEAVPTLTVGSVLMARDTMDDDLAFGITKAIWHERNAPLFQNGHPCGKLMNRALATSGVGVPVHPGAAKYYLAEGVPVPPPAATAPLRAGVPNART